MTTDLSSWLLEQIAKDETAAHQALLGFPVTDDLLGELEPALLTSEWTHSYHEVFQRMTDEPSAEWQTGRRSRLRPDLRDRWHWRDREKVADCGPANVYPARYMMTWDPKRALAECDAKRRRLAHIADELDEWRTGWHGELDRERAIDGWMDLLKIEALPYADRSGYREEWKP